jgi:nucleoside-diphosphate-sugar epimerase
MKVLFIGGTGIISSACTQLAVQSGLELFLLNRGQTQRPIPDGVEVIRGNIRNREEARKLLAKYRFDVVVDWIAFVPEHIETDIELFRGKTGQYVFISSASAYQTPPASLPVTESTPLYNPFWLYSRDKIACEQRLSDAYRQEHFPITIVRPSHTYDKTLLPFYGGYTFLDRLKKGKKVIIHGDGSSLWVLTHHRDFAKGFLGLLGNPQAIGETFHITSDQVLTWDAICTTMADILGVPARIVHVPSQVIAAYDAEWGASLLGDKTHSMIFDNSKIKRFVPGFRATIPFVQGAREMIEWYDEPSRQVIDKEFDRLMDHIIKAQEKAWPG